jgi:hypothetical protein
MPHWDRNDERHGYSWLELLGQALDFVANCDWLVSLAAQLIQALIEAFFS